MTRTVNSNQYDGSIRTATITEVTTLSEDLQTLASLTFQLSGIESRIEGCADITSPEGVFLLSERARLTVEIAAQQAAVDGYNTQ